MLVKRTCKSNLQLSLTSSSFTRSLFSSFFMHFTVSKFLVFSPLALASLWTYFSPSFISNSLYKLLYTWNLASLTTFSVSLFHHHYQKLMSQRNGIGYMNPTSLFCNLRQSLLSSHTSSFLIVLTKFTLVSLFFF